MAQEAFSLTGQHVVVVGASSGIGRAVAVRCAEAGARLSVCARREDRLKNLVSELTGEGHGFRRLDVRASDEIPRVFDGFVSARGPIDGMVYSAGFNVLRPINVLGREVADDMYEVNLRGAVLCCQAATANTRASRGGMSIVMISSMGARFPAGSGLTCYAATKAGLDGAMRALANELARRKIRVNTVAPGAVATEIWNDAGRTEAQKQAVYDAHPLGVGEVDDVAWACLYLLAPASRWVTGTAMVVDGGYGIA
ncbi:MAG: SDR family NAD(P)-dependent oxidoreductase [Planctomycetota bacterium]